ncbi:MAG TPA: nitrogen regulation protein NR(I) [Gammaproteobacteria bacterium]|nr:nitrogen regulation protein NR(I) [Gammaproteobacteria bacterium]
MTTSNETVWVVDDDASIRWVLARTLRQADLDVRCFESGGPVLKALGQQHPAVIVTDIRMPGIDGLELLEAIHQQAAELPVIIMTAHTDLDSAIAAYGSGAFEYLPKPFDIDTALALVQRALQLHPDENRVTGDSTAVTEPTMIGKAPAMQEVFRAIGRLSRSSLTTLICGESGTGKELVAHALFHNSPRANRPFVAINIAAIPAELMESELFGHEKGAFTGATGLRKGHFEQAHGGTLFLDEIGEMAPALQTRLLRVLSDNSFYRVGGHQQIHADVRVIAATNRKLEQQVTDGQFREDLYHRLNVIRIDLPPLRQRPEDLPALSTAFLQRAAKELAVEPKWLNHEALGYLLRYSWPGNVRQLENTCRWLSVMAPSREIRITDLPEDILLTDTSEQAPARWQKNLQNRVQQLLRSGQTAILADLLREFEAVLIDEVLHHTAGHKQQAAKILGWGRNTLTRKLKELGR